MRTIETKVYSFNELSEDAKQKVIESVRESYYKYNDFAEWAIDDCALFEPKHEELENIEGYNFPLLENTRQKIYFSADREWYLDCENALIVTNDEVFYKWLGIPEDVYDNGDFNYRIFTPRGRYETTTIDFDGYLSEYGDIMDAAKERFDDLMQDVLKRIEAGIDYRFSDEAIIEDIKANEFEFTEDGEKY